MADLILKVTPEEVRGKSREIDTQKNMMEAYMNDMQSKVNSLQNYWQSTSGENYIAKYQNIQKNISASLDALLKHANNLTSAAERYEGIETAQNSAVDSLSADNIF